MDLAPRRESPYSRHSSVAALYDNIGRTYSYRRQSDPRIAAAIEGALQGCASVLNVGAGAGSYEPRSRAVVAVEPSRTMIKQRPADAAPAVQAYAEALPFRDGSFDAVLGVLTVHHWKDLPRGFSECARVARRKIIFMTFDYDACGGFWLFDYFPELLHADQNIFPRMTQFADALGAIQTIPLPVAADCRDGFLGAYWQRPRAYLDPLVRSSISTFSKIGNCDSQLARLEKDIESGAWERCYGGLKDLDALELGYCLVIAPGRFPA